MNLNITWDEKHDIDNYINIHVSENDYLEKIKKIPDAGCKVIHVSEGAYLLDYKSVFELLQMCVTKLRMNGRISISVFNFYLICADYIGGSLESEVLSRYLSNMNSNVRYDEVSRIFYQNNIKLQGIDRAEYYQVLHGSR